MKHTLMTQFVLASALIFMACGIDTSPKPINVQKDACAGCKMTIMESKFAAEFISDKGKCFKFDDVCCMFHYIGKNYKNPEIEVKMMYIADFAHDGVLLDITKAYLVLGDEIKSPMNGGVAAFATMQEATNYAKLMNAEVIDSWKRLSMKH